MRERLRFFINTEGVNDHAVSALIQKAIELENTLGNVSRIVFVAAGLQNDGWLERQFGRDGVKKLKKGIRLPNSNVTAKFESLNNYISEENEILIGLGLHSNDILKLDDNFDILAILALPWLADDVEKWSRITNAVNIQSGEVAPGYDYPNCVVIKALEDLTRSINNSTGVLNSSDNDLAKTYLRSLAKYDYELNELEIEAYLINQLNWTKQHADDLILLINKLNNKRSFQGGAKTYLKDYIKRWEAKCSS